MERRLNCYNYIFSSCEHGDSCPYGHVLVNNREDYERKLESNEGNLRERTSPRGAFHIDLSKIGDQWKDYENSKKKLKLKHHYNLEESPLTLITCSSCNSLKTVNRSYYNYFKKRDDGYICKECEENIVHQRIDHDNANENQNENLALHNL